MKTYSFTLIPFDASAQYHLQDIPCLDSTEIEQLIELRIDSVSIEFDIDFLKVDWHTANDLDRPESQADLEFVLDTFRVRERARLVESALDGCVITEDGEERPWVGLYVHYSTPFIIGMQFKEVGLQNLISRYTDEFLEFLNEEGRNAVNAEVVAWESYLEHRSKLIGMDLEGGSGCGGTSAMFGYPTIYDEALEHRLEEVYKRYRYAVECYPFRPYLPYYNHQDE